MKTYKCFRMALNMVLHSKLRSWLTIIGIVIGVASVVAILGISEGLETEINGQFDDGGGDILSMKLGKSSAVTGPPGATEQSIGVDQEPITRIDVQALKGISDINVINTKISGDVDIYYLGERGTVTVTGVDQSVYRDISYTEILEGRTFSASDSNVILIGNELAKEYFKKEIGINQLISIDDKSFRVIGILDEDTNSVIMPINSAYDLIEDKVKGEYDTLEIKIKDQDKLDEVQAVMEKKLMQVRHVTEDSIDFTIISNAAAAELRAELLGTLTLFLTAIAGVSLLVGAVGVANTMFTSVLEKTKEIGILKAIGGRNGDILLIFVFNSALIGLVGGFLGGILGYIMIQLLTIVGMTAMFSFSNLIFVLLVSVVIGIISGIIPAYSASKLKPVDALRSE